ncbi:hypothetical protein J132_09544 [Termitomyces sp. J132]|nr:hypothetical protein J132_09544 [Termitomyces sp. J132]
MSPVLPSANLLSDSSNPSVPERIIRHKWDGAKYSCADGNFTQWTEKLEDTMILNGIYAYIFSPILPCPSRDTEPRAYANWSMNDCLAITFMKSALDDVKHRDLVTNKGAHYCFQGLKTCMQRERPIKQIPLLQEALSTYCSQSEPLPATAIQVADIVKRAFDIGTIDVDLFTCITLLNSLNNPSFEALQNSVSTLSKSTAMSPCMPTDIWLLMENVQNMINSKANTAQATAFNMKGGTRSHDTDLPGHNHGPGAVYCENCHSCGQPCQGHSKPFCVQKGGGMAGKSIADAQATQKASKKKSDSTLDSITTSAKSYVTITRIDGKLWYVNPSNLGQLPAPSKTATFTGIAAPQMPTPASDFSTECWEHAGFIAFEDAEQLLIGLSMLSQLKDLFWPQIYPWSLRQNVHHSPLQAPCHSWSTLEPWYIYFHATMTSTLYAQYHHVLLKDLKDPLLP